MTADFEQVVLEKTQGPIYSPYVVCAGWDIASARNNRSSGRGFVGRHGGGGMFQVQSCAARGRWLKREGKNLQVGQVSCCKCECQCGCGRPLSGILPPPSTGWPAGPASDRLRTGISLGTAQRQEGQSLHGRRRKGRKARRVEPRSWLPSCTCALIMHSRLSSSSLLDTPGQPGKPGYTTD